MAIRTVVVQAPSKAEYGAGGGITYDSDAEAEYAEALAKARYSPPSARRSGCSRRSVERHERVRPPAAAPRADPRLGRLPRVPVRSRVGGLVRREGGRRPDRPRCPRPAPARARGTLAADATPLGPATGPVQVALDDDPVDPGDVWLFHKTTRRAPYRASPRTTARRGGRGARQHTRRGDGEYDANPRGAVGGRWVTPPRRRAPRRDVPRGARARGAAVGAAVPIETLRTAEAIAS